MLTAPRVPVPRGATPRQPRQESSISAVGLLQSALGEHVTQPPRRPSRLDDDDYPAYTTGLAAELLGVQPAFLRSLDAAGLLTPNRSPGGQRRYSRAELTLALRVRELLDGNMPLIAAIRIVSLEQQLEAARRRIAYLESRPPDGALP
jgi:MerR family transcriptional regulator/heat shock protein HspR